MKIQTLSVVVPRPEGSKKCINNCPFCVSRMRKTEYVPTNFYTHIEIKRRLQFARDNGCNTMIITGEGEAIQNKEFLNKLWQRNKEITNPFLWIELQTTGVMLDEATIEYFQYNGVSTISLSVADIFSDHNNNSIIGTPPKGQINLEELCKKIKDAGLNLRLSINMIRVYNNYSPERIMKRAKELGADQVIFREFYVENNGCEEDKWIREHKAYNRTIDDIANYILKEGRSLERLPFGAMRYSINGISVVLDTNCMAGTGGPTDQTGEEVIRYLILRPNNKLYTKWNDKGSLIF